MTEYNLYCDETCHLEHDDSNSMALEPSSRQKKNVKRYASESKKSSRNMAYAPRMR